MWQTNIRSKSKYPQQIGYKNLSLLLKINLYAKFKSFESKQEMFKLKFAYVNVAPWRCLK